jgi:hypothetical protein
MVKALEHFLASADAEAGPHSRVHYLRTAPDSA